MHAHSGLVADDECVSFLQWALPRLGRRWAGYRKVRRQVCRRARRRARELGLGSLAGYRRHLEREPDEWRQLDALTNVTISRFHRDRGVFAFLRSDVLPDLAATATGTVRAWSAGCAGGEEPYTLAIIWELAIGPGTPGTQLEILGTDVEPAAFAAHGDELVLRPPFRRHVTVVHHDIRDEPPDGPFDLILCRNVAFTYFDDAGQRETLQRLARVSRPGAALVLGTHEHLPPGGAGFAPWAPQLGVYRRSSGPPYRPPGLASWAPSAPCRTSAP
jgi:chemotaxis protein methyltransferase CheR